MTLLADALTWINLEAQTNGLRHPAPEGQSIAQVMSFLQATAFSTAPTARLIRHLISPLRTELRTNNQRPTLHTEAANLYEADAA
jgi:hypothetical protein